jgi:chorismate mutase
MPHTLQALRGATTLDADTKEQVIERTSTLLRTMLERNGVEHDDLISVMFTATPDIRSEYPAAAARSMGISDVPLLCAQELDIIGGVPLCIRVMMHLTTDRARGDLRHVYLGGAEPLRTDLPR